VLDLGCWPGGWLEVAGRAVGAGGRVVGVDLVAPDAPPAQPNVVALQGDVNDPALADVLLRELGAPADVVLCDAAPKLTGVRATDRAREEALLEAVAALLARCLRPGGSLVLKVLESPEAQAVAKRVRARFESAKTLRPKATRKGSAERYLVARGFRG
jgi:23S rRNA (uridine2552-2'-O)-methyltransferase